MLIVVVGWIAAGLVFSSFVMRRMVPLRMAAIGSNVAFTTYALLGLAYGIFGRLFPILVLHASMLPLNVVRLREARRLVRTRVEQYERGELSSRPDDQAGRLRDVEGGSVRLRTSGTRACSRLVLSEVGLFASRAIGTSTPASDCRLATIGTRARRSLSASRLSSGPARRTPP